MRFTQRNRQIYSLAGCCLMVLLAACNSNTTPVPKGTPGITETRGRKPVFQDGDECLFLDWELGWGWYVGSSQAG